MACCDLLHTEEIEVLIRSSGGKGDVHVLGEE